MRGSDPMKYRPLRIVAVTLAIIGPSSGLDLFLVPNLRRTLGAAGFPDLQKLRCLADNSRGTENTTRPAVTHKRASHESRHSRRRPRYEAVRRDRNQAQA